MTENGVYWTARDAVVEQENETKRRNAVSRSKQSNTSAPQRRALQDVSNAATLDATQNETEALQLDVLKSPAKPAAAAAAAITNKREPVVSTKLEGIKLDAPKPEPQREPLRELNREPLREPKREPLREPKREPLREPKREPLREPKREAIWEPKWESMRESTQESTRESTREPREPWALHEQPLVSPNLNKRPRSESMEVIDEAAMERKTRMGPGGTGSILHSSPTAASSAFAASGTHDESASPTPSFIVRIALDHNVQPEPPTTEYEDDQDPQMCEEYAEDIYEFMYRTQEAYMVNPGYIDELPAGHRWHRNRSTLLNWLVTVHRKFRLVAETLYLATNVIDRFLSTNTVSLEEVQLLAASALFIASKYEEVITPAISNFAYVANATVDDVRSMEQRVLVGLQFSLGYPCPLNFLRRISRADDYDMRTRTVAKFMLEMSLFEPRLMVFRPSDVAAAAMFVAREILGMGEWTPSFVFYSGGCTRDGLAPIVEVMRDYLQGPCEQRDPEFVRQYMSKKVLRAALLATNWARGESS